MDLRGAHARRLVPALVPVLLLTGVAACRTSGVDGPTAASPGVQPSATAAVSSTASVATAATTSPRAHLPSSGPGPGTTPPPWLGERPLPVASTGFGQVRRTPPELVNRRFTLPDRLPALAGDGFASRVVSPAPAAVIARSTWKHGCPVAATDLSWVQVAFWGFDDGRHTGELLVNRSAAASLVSVFRRLYADRFPIEEMRITRLDELDAPPTGDGNNTGAFNCRPTTGGTSYSQHAYGLAVDVNPFQNPYAKGEVVLPELASSYLGRALVRPGMVTADGPVVRAFGAVGWTWGGTWHSAKDLQHFSENGR